MVNHTLDSPERSGDVAFQGSPCSDGVLGLAGTPLMFALASAAHLVPQP